MTKRKSDGTVGPWAREKLDALGEYLNFYTTVLKNQAHWCRGTVFVDAFAGPGKSKVRAIPKSSEPKREDFFDDVVPMTDDEEGDEFVNGSPRVALDIKNPFNNYFFIERDPQRVAELRTLAGDYGDTRKIVVKEGDASAELLAILGSKANWSGYRGVIFVDPFGMHIPWSTLEALAKTRVFEIIINFPLGMAIQRFLIRHGEIPANWAATLDDFFGSPDWRLHAYESSDTLFGSDTVKLADSGKRLLEWYLGRLKDAFGHVSPARLIRNTQGGHLYYLIWAGPHPKGLDGARAILGKGDEVRAPRKRPTAKR
ncbi:three-Cys-motif partner protein [Bosea psychrotolerans]|uniref:Three-Cys-motif partner protein n=2 Tax=Bosea psychrotolerans TaxID=1871628 RepID=A0A2S4M824_9HYPH|nr:three-Cys-motif partner protein [Bosea psychrotolerans]